MPNFKPQGFGYQPMPEGQQVPQGFGYQQMPNFKPQGFGYQPMPEGQQAPQGFGYQSGPTANAGDAPDGAQPFSGAMPSTFSQLMNILGFFFKNSQNDYDYED